MRDPVPVNKDQGSASTILVVEDEVLIRLHVAEELREAGFPVLEAADAGEALEILSHVDGVELIATDLRMPGELDGLALARKVRLEFPHIKVVLMSGNYVSPEPALDAVFCKPLKIEAFVRQIQQSLQRAEHGGCGGR